MGGLVFEANEKSLSVSVISVADLLKLVCLALVFLRWCVCAWRTDVLKAL